MRCQLQTSGCDGARWRAGGPTSRNQPDPQHPPADGPLAHGRGAGGPALSGGAAFRDQAGAAAAPGAPGRICRAAQHRQRAATLAPHLLQQPELAGGVGGPERRAREEGACLGAGTPALHDGAALLTHWPALSPVRRCALPSTQRSTACAPAWALRAWPPSCCPSWTACWDPEPAVAAEAALLSARTCAAGLLRKRHILAVAARLCSRQALGPGAPTPVRAAAVEFLAAAAGQLSAADAQALPLPLALPCLAAEPLSLTVGRKKGGGGGGGERWRGGRFLPAACTWPCWQHHCAATHAFSLSAPPCLVMRLWLAGPQTDCSSAGRGGQQQQQRRSKYRWHTPPSPHPATCRAHAAGPASAAAARCAPALWYRLSRRWHGQRAAVARLPGCRWLRPRCAGWRQQQRDGWRRSGHSRSSSGGKPQHAAATAHSVHLQPDGWPPFPHGYYVKVATDTNEMGHVTRWWY